MRKTSLVLALVAAWLINRCADTAYAAEPTEDQPAAGVADADGPAADSPDALSLAELEALVEPLPEVRRLFTHTYRAGRVTSREEAVNGRAAATAAHAGLSQEKLIYSNTRGDRVLRLGAPNRRIGDDLQTESVSGCDLTRYVVRVNGGVQDGTGTFTCKVSLWDGCPNPLNGGELIVGTDAVFSGLADDITIMHDLEVDVASNPIPLPTKAWIRLECDIAPAGWVVGTPAELGFTSGAFYWPLYGCIFADFPPNFHLGFYAQIFAADDPAAPCGTHWLAYSSNEPTSAYYSASPSVVEVADDFKTSISPFGGSCILNAYEIAARGTGGPFTLTTELRTPFTFFPITGTEFTLQGKGDGSIEFARIVMDPDLDIVIPSTPLWYAWQSSHSSAGPIMTYGSVIGASDPYISLYYGFPCPYCPPVVANPPTAYLKIFCKGNEPVGACCFDSTPSVSPYCEENLPSPACDSGRWQWEESCEYFDLYSPCGSHACCLPNDTCADLFQTECESQEGIWYFGENCSTREAMCQHHVCLTSADACQISHDSRGCKDVDCCQEVCDVDANCCAVAWDEHCVRIANQECGCSTPPGDRCVSSTPAGDSAQWIVPNSALAIDNCFATVQVTDPLFCCTMFPPTLAPGTVFFRFMATDTSARINTCGTVVGDAGDSMLQVLRVGDSTNDTSSCNSLTSMACNDNAPGCGDGTMSDVCVAGLTPGETYYVVLASKTPQDRGIYHLTLESPCPAAQLTGPCNDGIVEWLIPATDTVIDARQPFDPGDPTVPLGVSSFIVAAPPGADDPACWILCDTLGNPLDNHVLTMAGNGDGTLTLHLQSPITPGAATTVTYASSSACAPVDGNFQSLPGDIDGQNGVLASTDGANFADLCLTGLPGTMMERCDIDRSGVLTSSDLIRLLDLMNGAGPFDPWLGKTVSSGACE